MSLVASTASRRCVTPRVAASLAATVVLTLVTAAWASEPGRRIGEPGEELLDLSADGEAALLGDAERVRVVDLRHGRVSAWQPRPEGALMRLADEGGAVLFVQPQGKLRRWPCFALEDKAKVVPIPPGALDLAIDAGGGHVALTTRQQQPPPGPRPQAPSAGGFACVHALAVDGTRTVQRCVPLAEGEVRRPRIATSRDGSRLWFWAGGTLLFLDAASLRVLGSLDVPEPSALIVGEVAWRVVLQTADGAAALSAPEGGSLSGPWTPLSRGAAIAVDASGKRVLGAGWTLLREDVGGAAAAVAPAAALASPHPPQWSISPDSRHAAVQMGDLLAIVRVEPTFSILGLLPTIRRGGVLAAHPRRLIWRGADNAIRAAVWSELDTIPAPAAGLDVCLAAAETARRLLDVAAGGGR
ncbi:MAG: hypothetical protein H6747_12825 [Deltaproteobacteria bacterium]|nr:hypothetical protein [Deltaproteobacteria bacterium]